MSDDEQQEHQEQPDEELEAIRTSFTQCDVNKDGHISATDVETVLRALGKNPTTKEINDLLAEADKNKDSKLDLEEFGEIWKKKFKHVDATAQLEQAWDDVDRNHNGYLERDELRRCIKKKHDIDVDEKELKEFLDLMDTNNDGKVDKHEFIKVTQSRAGTDDSQEEKQIHR